VTIQTQYLAEFKDIQGLRLTCNKCSGSVVLPISERTNIPEICPNCRQSWFLVDSLDLQVLDTLVRACYSLGERNTKGGFQAHLELNAPIKGSDREGK